ncbi:helix-turn-helix domain-containing protein [Olivibacter jilunii]|uniref:helix-turn-helix domain-containing protein n=1 Tax=Olivibacter jilunii TaxID=985016 RepID=UPI003F1882D9
MDYIIAAGMFQAGIAVALLWLNKKRKQDDNLLITLLACITVHLFAKWVIYALVSDKDIQLGMNTFIQLAYGPLIYLYGRKLARKKLFIPHLLLFLPMLLAAIVYFSVISLLVFEPHTGHRILAVYNDYTSHLIVYGNGLYAVLTWHLLSKQKTAIAYTDYKLLRQITFIFIVMALLSIIYMIKERDFQQLMILRYIVYSLLTLICFLVVRHKYVGANDDEAYKTSTANEPKEGSSERKPILLAHQLSAYANTINTYMEEIKAYRDVDFNMDKMSAEIGISKRYISETLNTQFSKSFYQYLNEYRIQDFIRELDQRVEQGESINMLHLAYRCGFKNKSSFNQYFKKITGMTPSCYIKSQQQPDLVK